MYDSFTNQPHAFHAFCSCSCSCSSSSCSFNNGLSSFKYVDGIAVPGVVGADFEIHPLRFRVKLMKFPLPMGLRRFFPATKKRARCAQRRFGCKLIGRRIAGILFVPFDVDDSSPSYSSALPIDDDSFETVVAAPL